ncbi:MAG: hypothetical protein ABEI52_06200, partial [Halobacteriaceae archaeon]
ILGIGNFNATMRGRQSLLKSIRNRLERIHPLAVPMLLAAIVAGIILLAFLYGPILAGLILLALWIVGALVVEVYVQLKIRGYFGGYDV